MRLLLASSRPQASDLHQLLAPGSRVAVVVNAQDGIGARARRRAVAEEEAHLSAAGLLPGELDLRRFYRSRDGLAVAVAESHSLWVAGGNVFVLREAMRRSRLDALLRQRGHDVVYVGWSAGACVCGPTLRGLELVEDLPRGAEPTWDGLGLVDFAVVPHYQSAPPLGEEIDRVVEFWESRQTPFRALRDGESVTLAGQPAPSVPGSGGGALR